MKHVSFRLVAALILLHSTGHAASTSSSTMLSAEQKSTFFTDIPTLQEPINSLEAVSRFPSQGICFALPVLVAGGICAGSYALHKKIDLNPVHATILASVGTFLSGLFFSHKDANILKKRQACCLYNSAFAVYLNDLGGYRERVRHAMETDSIVPTHDVIVEANRILTTQAQQQSELQQSCMTYLNSKDVRGSSSNKFFDEYKDCGPILLKDDRFGGHPAFMQWPVLDRRNATNHSGNLEHAFKDPKQILQEVMQAQQAVLAKIPQYIQNEAKQAVVEK